MGVKNGNDPAADVHVAGSIFAGCRCRPQQLQRCVADRADFKIADKRRVNIDVKKVYIDSDVRVGASNRPRSISIPCATAWASATASNVPLDSGRLLRGLRDFLAAERPSPFLPFRDRAGRLAQPQGNGIHLTLRGNFTNSIH